MKILPPEASSRFRHRALAMALVAAIVLVLAGVGAYAYYAGRPAAAQKVVGELVKLLGNKHILGEKGWRLFVGIFVNNTVSTLITLLLGVVPFLFLPLANPVMNGGVIGLLAAVSKQAGMPMVRFFLAGIAPHGIFELTAVLYATGLGLSLTLEVIRKILLPTPAESPSFPRLVLSALRSWAVVVLPLLLVAAAVETFITPRLLGIGRAGSDPPSIFF